MRAGDRGDRGDRGFTLPGLLVAVAILLTGLQAAAFVTSHQMQREREREALRIGGLYAGAIERYREASPGGLKTYPASLEDLLLDRRFVGTVRHLRRLYDDPLRPGRPWQPVLDADGRVVGVRSSSDVPPVVPGRAGSPDRPAGPIDLSHPWTFLARRSP